MSKSKPSTIISDADAKVLSGMDEKLTRSVNSLKRRNRELASLGNLLKANTSNTTSFMKKVADEVGVINDALSKTSTSMTKLESNISTLAVNMARGFDKMAQAAQKALQASQAAGQASTSVGASGGGATWWEKWRQRAQTADDKIFSADVKNGKATDADFQAMQQMEIQWKTIVNVSSQYLNQMAQVAIQQEKLNLATSQQAQELAEIAAKYQQIAQLNKATAQNQNFDEGTYTQTQRQRTSLQQKQTGAVQGDNTLVEMQAQLAMMREQLNTLRQKKKLDDDSYRNQRRETLLQRERQRALDREIKSELERERIKKRIAVLEAKAALSSQEQAELQENKAKLKASKSTKRSTTGAGASYFNTTGQMIQVIRELPNFAISAQTGLMSLSNNLPTLFEGFSMAAKEAGGLNGVLKMLFNGATLLNLGFVAFTVVLMNADKIIKALTGSYFDFGDTLEDVADGLRNGNSELAKSIESWELMYQAISNANVGIISGADALNEYNEKFATTYGYAKDIATAYDLMTKNADKYYQTVINHEIALAVQKQAIKMFEEAIADQLDSHNWFTRIFADENVGDQIESWIKMQENLNKAANGEGASWDVYGGKYHSTLLNMNDTDGGMYSKVKYGNKHGSAAIVQMIKDNEVLKREGVSAWAAGATDEKQIKLITDSGKISERAQKEITAIFNKFVPESVAKNLKRGIEPFMEQFRAIMGIASEFEQEGFPKTSSKGGARGARSAPHLAVIQPRDGFTADKFTNERREQLIKENERLERSFSKQYDSGDKDMYQKRLDALRDYIRNKQEIAEIDAQKEIWNAREKRERDLHKIKEERESYNARLADMKKRRDEWIKYVGSTEFKMGKDQAQAKYNDAVKERDKLSEELKGQGIKEGTQQFIDLMTAVNNKLSEAEETLGTYVDTSGAALNAAIAKSEANIADWEKKAQDREKKIRDNFQKDYVNAIYEGTSKIVKAREEGLQKAIDIHKTALNRDLDLVRENYEKELRIIEQYYERVARLRAMNGALGYETTGGMLATMGETLAKGFSNYQRDSNVSGLMGLFDKRDKNIAVEAETNDARIRTDATITDYQNKAKKYARANDTDKLSSLRESFKADMEKSGKYEATEIDDMLVKWNEAVKGIDTTEGQRAFDELKKSATKNLDETLEKCKETRQALDDEIKDKWGEALTNQAVEVFKSFTAMLDAMLDAEIEYQKRAVNNWVETQTKLVEDQYKSQVIDEKEYQAQKEAIAAEQRKREHEIAIKEEKANRVKATSNVMIATAQAITYAAIAAFRDGGIAAAPMFIAYSALLAANAAMQIAAIHAAPYPEYAEGTDFHKGGLAIVGDAGKSELIETKSGRLYKTPDVPTLMDIERGAKVHPDFSVAMRNLNDDRQIVVLSENKKQLTLLRQTNKSLGAIVANTRTQQRNYNRVWN